MAHRGPDGDGLYSTLFAQGSRQLVLAHRRLAVIDLAGGAQPMSSEDGSIVLVFNGEIYNFKALRGRLEVLGHRFRTASDTETIIHAYEEYGLHFVHALRGAFAFALWDARRERLVLARDRFGEKPIVYARTSQGLVFGSEMKALLSWPGIDGELDHEGLRSFLRYRYSPSPTTLIRGIRKLPAGCLGIVEGANDLRIERYYTPPDAQPPQGLTETDPIAGFLRVLDEAVGLMMVSDVPYGAFLSGGLDSSAIVALMARRSSHPIRTFSIGFDRRGFSELEHAGTVARAFSTDHTSLQVTDAQVVDLMTDAPRLRDGPLSEPADIPVLLLAREARRRVTVVLTGEGSDEVLGGYPKHLFERYGQSLLALPPALRALAARELGRLPYGTRRLQTALLASECTSFQERMPRWFGAFSQRDVDALLSEPAAATGAEDGFPFLPAGTASALRRALFFDQTSWLPDNLLERGDRMTMAASIEARMPFMDHRLIEYAASLPDSLRVRGLTTKRVLRQAMESVLPAAILARPKVGFRTPVHLWLRQGKLKEMLLDILMSPSARLAPCFQRQEVGRYVDEHLSGLRNHEKALWTLLGLELWARSFSVRL